MQRLLLASAMLLMFTTTACLQSNTKPAPSPHHSNETFFLNEKGEKFSIIKKSDAEWKQEMDELTYHVMREKGTERAWTGKYNTNKKKGTYVCNACKLPLFSSDTKFDSGTGWPSFYQPVDSRHVKEEVDNAYGMKRVEVLCHRCNGHLGHVFDDGPKPTGLRYCMNSVSLDFIPE